MSSVRRPVSLAAVLAAIFSVIVAPVALLVVAKTWYIDWSLWRQATCLPDMCFCEALASGSVRQWSNAVSSLAFCVVAAIVVLWPASTRADSNSRLDKYLFWGAASVIGIGSAFFHASLTFWGQTSDVLGMYLLATLLLLWNLRQRLSLSAIQGLSAYVGANVVLVALLIMVPALRRYLFAALILAVFGLEFSARGSHGKSRSARDLGYAVAVLGIGFAIWIGDITRLACSPTSWIQGHAVWHLCGAASSFMIYRYYHPSDGQIE